MVKAVIVLQTFDKTGGTERASKELGRILNNLGYKVKFISFYKSKSVVDRNDCSVEYLIDTYISVYSKRIINKVLDLLLRKKLKDKLLEESPDFVFFTNLSHVVFNDSVYKTILMVHFSFIYFNSGLLTSYLFKKWYKKIDRVVFLTAGDSLKYEEFFGSPNNSRYVANSVNFIRQNNEIKKKNKIVFLGRLDENQKQITHLVKIISLIKNKTKEKWELDIYGEGDDRNKIERDIIELKCSDVITLRGNTNDVISALADSKIMVLTSKFEGLPVCLIEGAFSGLALISYACAPGINDIIIDGVNGYVIEQDNIEVFSDKLLSLTNSPEVLSNFQKASISIAELKFSPQSVEKHWVKVMSDMGVR
ncbi:glycosyltransferase [Klebsiella pneumoniae]|uniref:glycosyltransferase n=1 Tax=Klebsiella pneumoniae complex TaxID=3390273 RepID=UPI0007CA5EB3|nr:glycosyltransferase [Klebsiella pneumoniae]SAR59940.1 glycosyl transferase [Klebsiella pneumoniae]